MHRFCCLHNSDMSLVEIDLTEKLFVPVSNKKFELMLMKRATHVENETNITIEIIVFYNILAYMQILITLHM